MTVASGARAEVSGDGSTTTFNPTFRANSAAEIAVVVVTDSDGTKVDQVLNTDYTVTFDNGVSGVPVIEFTTAPASATTVRITPNANIEQTTAISDTTPLFGSTVQSAIDAIAAQLQSIEDRLKTTLRVADDDPAMTSLGDWKDRLDTYAFFNATTGQLEAKALALIQADLGSLDADLAAIAALTPSDDDIIQRKASAWVNRTMTQLAVDLGDKLPDGTVSLPGISFATDPNSGFYAIGADEWGHATAGVKNHGVDAAGIHVWPLQPAFMAYANSDVLNVTGDGTAYVMLYNTEVHDRNADYTPGTGIFTAPVTGVYDFSGSISLLALGAATSILVELVTTNRTYRLINIAGADDVSNAITLNWSVLCADMDAAETAKVQITVSGITKVVDIDGGSDARTFFSGRMVG